MDRARHCANLLGYLMFGPDADRSALFTPEGEFRSALDIICQFQQRLRAMADDGCSSHDIEYMFGLAGGLFKPFSFREKSNKPFDTLRTSAGINLTIALRFLKIVDGNLKDPEDPEDHLDRMTNSIVDSDLIKAWQHSPVYDRPKIGNLAVQVAYRLQQIANEIGRGAIDHTRHVTNQTQYYLRWWNGLNGLAQGGLAFTPHAASTLKLPKELFLDGKSNHDGTIIPLEKLSRRLPLDIIEITEVPLVVTSQDFVLTEAAIPATIAQDAEGRRLSQLIEIPELVHAPRPFDPVIDRIEKVEVANREELDQDRAMPILSTLRKANTHRRSLGHAHFDAEDAIYGEDPNMHLTAIFFRHHIKDVVTLPMTSEMADIFLQGLE